MAKRFVFVDGDIGGANYQLPVIRRLVQMGYFVEVLADPKGNGMDVFKKADISFRTEGSFDPVFEPADVFFINTCATATDLETRVLLKVSGKSLVVMGSDGFFNHGFSQWREVPTNYPNLYWFAINQGHAQAIRELRPGLDHGKVLAVGQPAFDSVLEYIPKKAQVRSEVRASMGLKYSDVNILWWSQGMLELIYEDIMMLFHGLKYLSRNLPGGKRICLIPRIHPKINKTVSDGYIDELKSLLYFTLQGENISIKMADTVQPEGLCLAADVILSVTCTEDVKNVIMGGPPVVHLIGPLVRRYFTEELGQIGPYLPDIRTGQSLVAWSADQVGPMINTALDPVIRSECLKNWQAPTERATDVVADKLVAIAEGRI